MGVNRRDFLKLAGISGAAGLLGRGGFELLFPGQASAAGYAVGKKALGGKRWALAIDMKRFWKNPGSWAAPVEACHKTHNVPHISNHLHEIKWIWTEKYPYAFPNQEFQNMSKVKDMPFLILCNHCDNPPCVRVCPTQATFRRDDGVVMMDMHRCIGCRYCMAACPYGSRSFNWSNPRSYMKDVPNPDFPTRMRGVVEKCNLCAERLAVGKKPACVDASKGAIVFGDMGDPKSEVRQVLAKRYSIRRKPGLGTRPHVFYLV